MNERPQILPLRLIKKFTDQLHQPVYELRSHAFARDAALAYQDLQQHPLRTYMSDSPIPVDLVELGPGAVLRLKVAAQSTNGTGYHWVVLGLERNDVPDAFHCFQGRPNEEEDGHFRLQPSWHLKRARLRAPKFLVCESTVALGLNAVSKTPDSGWLPSTQLDVMQMGQQITERKTHRRSTRALGMALTAMMRA